MYTSWVKVVSQKNKFTRSHVDFGLWMNLEDFYLWNSQCRHIIINHHSEPQDAYASQVPGMFFPFFFIFYSINNYLLTIGLMRWAWLPSPHMTTTIQCPLSQPRPLPQLPWPLPQVLSHHDRYLNHHYHEDEGEENDNGEDNEQGGQRWLQGLETHLKPRYVFFFSVFYILLTFLYLQVEPSLPLWWPLHQQPQRTQKRAQMMKPSFRP